MDCRHIIVVIHEAGHFELKNVLRHRPIYRCNVNSLFEFPTESIIISGPVSIKTVIRAFGNPLIENVNSASELPMIVIDGCEWGRAGDRIVVLRDTDGLDAALESEA